MSLPELTTPPGVPVFLAAGHAIALRSLYVEVPMTSGHARKRRVYTQAPRVVDVALLLTDQQMADLDDWYETTLLVGTRPFAAQVAGQGGGVLWWRAEWLVPYLATPLHRRRWRVEGQLLVSGTGSATGPVLGTLAAEISVPLKATAWLRVAPQLAAEIGVPLEFVEA